MDEKLAFQMRQINKYLTRLREVAKTAHTEYLAKFNVAGHF